MVTFCKESKKKKTYYAAYITFHLRQIDKDVFLICMCFFICSFLGHRTLACHVPKNEPIYFLNACYNGNRYCIYCKWLINACFIFLQMLLYSDLPPSNQQPMQATMSLSYISFFLIICFTILKKLYIDWDTALQCILALCNCLLTNRRKSFLAW